WCIYPLPAAAWTVTFRALNEARRGSYAQSSVISETDGRRGAHDLFGPGAGEGARYRRTAGAYRRGARHPPDRRGTRALEERNLPHGACAARTRISAARRERRRADALQQAVRARHADHAGARPRECRR